MAVTRSKKSPQNVHRCKLPQRYTHVPETYESPQNSSSQKSDTSEFHTEGRLVYRAFVLWFSVEACHYRTVVTWDGKRHPRTGHEGPEGEQMYSFTLSLTSALDRGGWSTTRTLYHRENPGTHWIEVGWTPGPVRTCAENLARTRIRSSDPPARSE